MRKNTKRLITLVLIALTLFFACINVLAEENEYFSSMVDYIIDGSEGFEKENYENLLDGDIETKWCVPVTQDKMAVICWKTKYPVNISGYRFITGDDNSIYKGRNPNIWRVIVSKDGINWTVYEEVNLQSQGMEDIDYAAYNFNADYPYSQDDYYQYFRFEFYETTGSNLLQLSEIQLNIKSIKSNNFIFSENYYPVKTNGISMNGSVIGNEKGWDNTSYTGAAAAFDENPNTYFDPLGKGDGYCGIKMDELYILTEVAVLSRDEWENRLTGAQIQGSNDGETWITLYQADIKGSNNLYFHILSFENNTGFLMYRYYNEVEHGDIAELKFYGYPLNSGALNKNDNEIIGNTEEPNTETSEPETDSNSSILDDNNNTSLKNEFNNPDNDINSGNLKISSLIIKIVIIAIVVSISFVIIIYNYSKNKKISVKTKKKKKYKVKKKASKKNQSPQSDKSNIAVPFNDIPKDMNEQKNTSIEDENLSEFYVKKNKEQKLAIKNQVPQVDTLNTDTPINNIPNNKYDSERTYAEESYEDNEDLENKSELYANEETEQSDFITIYCNSCGAKNTGDSAFCAECGSKLEQSKDDNRAVSFDIDNSKKYCHSCGAEIDDEMVFCANCGSKCDS